MPPLNVKKNEVKLAISIIEKCLKGDELKRNFINLSDINIIHLKKILKEPQFLKNLRKKNKTVNTLKSAVLAMILKSRLQEQEYHLN